MSLRGLLFVGASLVLGCGGNDQGTKRPDGGGGAIDAGGGAIDGNAGAIDGGGGAIDGGPRADARPGTNPCEPPASLTLEPAAMSASVQAGASFSQAYTATAHYPGQADVDVTSDTFFATADASAGSF